jgi:hypothetical protein
MLVLDLPASRCSPQVLRPATGRGRLWFVGHDDTTWVMSCYASGILCIVSDEQAQVRSAWAHPLTTLCLQHFIHTDAVNVRWHVTQNILAKVTVTGLRFPRCVRREGWQYGFVASRPCELVCAHSLLEQGYLCLQLGSRGSVANHDHEPQCLGLGFCFGLGGTTQTRHRVYGATALQIP